MLRSTLAWCVAVVSLALPTSCGVGESCAGSGSCACPPDYCPDLVTTAKDSGKTFRLAVGEWVSLELPGDALSAVASSSDPTVISVVGKTKSAVVNFQKVFASFHALSSGSAQLRFGYQTCDSTTPNPCSYEIEMHVIRFPKTNVTIDNVFEHSTVNLKMGDIARLSAPFDWDPAWKVTIDSPDVLRWAIEPIYLSHSLFESVITPVSRGTAHIQTTPCPGPDPICMNPWRLTVVVS